MKEYNTRRPHQALDMAYPADRFRTAAEVKTAREADLLPLKLPATLANALATTSPSGTAAEPPARPDTLLTRQRWAGDAIEFDRVVPPSGNLGVAGKQFWLGPARAGVVVTIWADTDVIHLLIAGSRVKSLRSHLRSTIWPRCTPTVAVTPARPHCPRSCRVRQLRSTGPSAGSERCRWASTSSSRRRSSVVGE